MKTNYWVVLIFSCSAGNAQTAKEYFLPSKEKNVSIFKRAGLKDANEFDINSKVFFKDMIDSVKITTMYYDDHGLRGGQEQIVRMDDSEISLIRRKANTSTGIETYDGDGEIIFKMPPNKGKIEWSNPWQKGAVQTIYTAEFSKIKVNGKKEKAVKISRIEKRKHSGKQFVFFVDYYVAGIGRYKRTTESGQAFEILKEQTYNPSPPSVN